MSAMERVVATTSRVTRPRRSVGVVAALAAVAVLAGACGERAPEPAAGNESGDRPSASTTSRAPLQPRVPGSALPPTTVLPYSGAPKVSSPLPPTALDRPPCGSLSFAQLATVFATVPQPQAQQAVFGQVCRWWPEGVAGPKLTLTHATLGDGLSAIFRAHEERGAYLRAMKPVRGYPMVAFDATPQTPDEKRGCQAAVGIADSRVFWLEYKVDSSAAKKPDPCAEVTRLADLILINLGAP